VKAPYEACALLAEAVVAWLSVPFWDAYLPVTTRDGERRRWLGSYRFRWLAWLDMQRWIRRQPGRLRHTVVVDVGPAQRVRAMNRARSAA
jgi:hypothetical protein